MIDDNRAMDLELSSHAFKRSCSLAEESQNQDKGSVMTSRLLKILLLVLASSGSAMPDSFNGRQCPNLADSEQPYLYLFTSEGYQGDPLYITNASIEDLGHMPTGLSVSSRFDDQASSFMLRGKWRICVDRFYQGRCVDVSSASMSSELMVPSIENEFGAEFDDAMSSVKLLGCSQY